LHNHTVDRGGDRSRRWQVRVGSPPALAAAGAHAGPAPALRPCNRADTGGPRRRGRSAACHAEGPGDLCGTRRGDAAPPLARLKPGSAVCAGATRHGQGSDPHDDSARRAVPCFRYHEVQARSKSWTRQRSRASSPAWARG
jgi:hypothetical protein